VALALATLGIVWAERTLAKTPASLAAATSAPPQAAPWMLSFLFAVLLLGIGFQIHFSLNTAALFLRHTSADQLPYLMPVFWIGFNVLMLPASIATKRFGGLAVAAFGAALAAAAAFAAYRSSNLNVLLTMQFLAGGGWGCVLMSAVSAALAIGHTGKEGKMTGGLFSLLALAAFARIAVLAVEPHKDQAFASVLTWAPVAAWGLAGLILLMLLPKQRKGAAAAPA
jgi:hypothetical protein